MLDEVASAMWAVLTGHADRVRALDGLAARYDVDRSRLDADLASFSRTCVSEGLLQPADYTTASDPPAPPKRAARRGAVSARAALASLLGTRRALARDGFRATYERYGGMRPGRDPARLPEALRGFVRAENLFVAGRAPNDCLIRSLALYRYLRSADVPAEHLIGVKRFPLQAHAWVEVEGSPVLDARAQGLGFAPLARLA